MYKNDLMTGHPKSLTARLDDGRIVEYDLCSYYGYTDFFGNDNFIYLGDGYIHSVDGVIQETSTGRRHFFKRRK